MERFPLRRLSTAQRLHVYLEASALAFADRAKYLGDPAFVNVPRSTLLSDRYAASRACTINLTAAMTKPTAAGDVKSYDPTCGGDRRARRPPRPDTENVETTNLTVTDKRGNVVEYTLTIEQTGGSGLLLPGRGFLLNNELTDFSAVYDAGRPEPDPARQAAAVLDLADDHPARRQAVRGPRLTRRLDDHHDRAADDHQPDRPAADAAAVDRRPARLAAQHRRGQRRAGVHREVRRRAHARSGTS